MSELEIYKGMVKKMKDEYKTKVTSISGYCGANYDENLERFKKKLKKQGDYDYDKDFECVITIYDDYVE